MQWTSQSPHQHRVKPENNPNSGLGDHNYCRNHDGRNTIWCFTTDPETFWETCQNLRTPLGITKYQSLITSNFTSLLDRWLPDESKFIFSDNSIYSLKHGEKGLKYGGETIMFG